MISLPHRSLLACAVVLGLFGLAAAPVFAQDTVELETVEVTSAKLPVNLRDDTASVSVVTGDELRARGASDLRTALSLVAGVDVAPGGDNGPAGSVPALWGLREFDAFLLVVDGVPWGGAFNPALVTMDLNNVDRIEVVKGAAPVSYGATSFVGVIHVLHRAAGKGPASIAIGAGSRGSARVSAVLPFSSASSRWQQSLLVDGEHQGLSADRSGWGRAHALYRGAGKVGAGDFTFDFDATRVQQEPVSPHPAEGNGLSGRVPLDANDNPRGAQQDQSRTQVAFGYVLPTGIGEWSTRLAASNNTGETVRGFLRPDFADDGVTHNADGYQQKRQMHEVYFDTHVASRLGQKATLVWGADFMGGNGIQRSNNFEYAVLPNGSNAPEWQTLHIDESTELDDHRRFTGVYAALDVAVTDAWRIDAGVRYNHTQESRSGQAVDLTGPTPVPGERSSQSQSNKRWSGSIGTSYRLYQSGRDYVTAYANYRNTFKPAAIDFGPEAESQILHPETAHSSEIGARGAHLDGRLQWDVSLFRMNFSNLVVAQVVNGGPGLANAGNEHFKGVEAELQWRLADDLHLVGTWARHDARFADYAQSFDGVLTQLDGNQLELSPKQIGSLGVMFAPEQGLRAYATLAHVGSRYLDRRNTTLAPAYNTVDAGIGYRHGPWEARLDGNNLTNRRDPVAGSELGAGQFYRMSPRTVWASFRYDIPTE